MISHEIDINVILSKLTLEEKISLLSAKDWWRTPVIQRDDVFVPHLKTTDGPNGARGESYVSGIKAACFPCASSLGSTFDEALVYKLAQEVAEEAKTKTANILLAPTLNVIRSPLGGRNYETYSEDPVVLGKLAAAYVNGCQSRGIAATPKHFVANEAENRRTQLSVEVDEQTLREIYLYPFQLVMKYSSPSCFMTSYNRVNGTYVADSHRLIEEVLRKEWGFKGLVMSDWMGTYSTATCINSGMDLEMPGPTFWRGPKLLEAIKQGLVSEETINKSAKRVLELAKTLGRFENPHEGPEKAVVNPERDQIIRDAASEGMVLLKNQDEVLPLKKGSSISIIGHFAKVASLGGGGSAKVNSLHAANLLEGLDTLGIDYSYAPGVPVFAVLPHAENTIVTDTTTKKSSEKPVKLEWFNGPMIGQNLVHEEMISSCEYMIKEKWPQYLADDYCTRMTFDITPKTSGPHTLSIISTGPAICYIDDKEVFNLPQETDLKPESFYFFKSKLERRFNFEMQAGQTYTLRLESWATDPKILNAPPINGKMFQGSTLRFFEHVDISEEIRKAVDLASKSEITVVCVGTTNEIESEGYDRDTMDLLPDQYRLIKAVAANSKIVVVNFSGAPVSMIQFVDNVAAIVQAWFPGQECGHSVARILTGEVNPSGRLPLSWPKKIEDNPSFGNFPVDEHDILRYEEKLDIGYRFYDRKNTPKPLFPFGFGLSYTTFEISDATVSSPNMTGGPAGSIEISCQVRNTGLILGKEVVQFYVRMPDTDIGASRPVKELKHFVKVELKAGEQKTIVVQLDKDSVNFYDAVNACWRAQKGAYTVQIGHSSVDIATQVEFSIPEEFTWTGI